MININNEISVENMQLKYGTRPLIYELRVERERGEKRDREREREGVIIFVAYLRAVIRKVRSC